MNFFIRIKNNSHTIFYTIFHPSILKGFKFLEIIVDGKSHVKINS